MVIYCDFGYVGRIQILIVDEKEKAQGSAQPEHHIRLDCIPSDHKKGLDAHLAIELGNLLNRLYDGKLDYVRKGVFEQT